MKNLRTMVALEKGFITFDAEKLMHVDTIVHNEMRDTDGDVNDLSDGLNSIYILSLLETYAEYGSTVPYIILIEDPEIYLHPQLQKVASEILFKKESGYILHAFTADVI